MEILQHNEMKTLLGGAFNDETGSSSSEHDYYSSKVCHRVSEETKKFYPETYAYFCGGPSEHNDR